MNISDTTGEKSRAGQGFNTLTGQTPPRGSPRATLVIGEVLFHLKIPADNSSNADTALAGFGQEPLVVTGTAEGVRGSPGEVNPARAYRADIAGTTNNCGTTPHLTVGSVSLSAYSL
jgi:hypothetical protein